VDGITGRRSPLVTQTARGVVRGARHACTPGFSGSIAGFHPCPRDVPPEVFGRTDGVSSRSGVRASQMKALLPSLHPGTASPWLCNQPGLRTFEWSVALILGGLPGEGVERIGVRQLTDGRLVHSAACSLGKNSSLMYVKGFGTPPPDSAGLYHPRS
jgi:hypothetical protein